MEGRGNIVIGDRSALHFLTHCDAAEQIASNREFDNPMENCTGSATEMHAFNFENSLYGAGPVSLLVPNGQMRRVSQDIRCAQLSGTIPPGSFFKLREGLYMTAPELTFLRMATLVNENVLSEIGMRLCAAYYLDAGQDSLPDRSELLTTPERLSAYIDACLGQRGTKKARRVLNLIAANSKSPMEDKLKLQMCNPMTRGGFHLPFYAMNPEIRASARKHISSQDAYSVDLANTKLKVALEYDGGDTHPDPRADVKRRNELKALGWEVFPLNSSVLYSPTATVRFAEQVAKYLNIRLRYPKCWEERFVQLRHDLDLPV